MTHFLHIRDGAINDYSAAASGGIVAVDVDITCSSTISGISLNNGNVTIESNQTMMLDNDIVIGTNLTDTASGATI